ncbi:3-methyl-2-oxobutanoate hydroxymethyltransferase [Tabrizicola piscis]|uniref:3-methyl-2-oxobutanoate hydroxymethyltransferase n=1 Tax=Tabrizicola piscis TaxID=2494374 RepID=A0A3S8U711_9RHOB|nr:3-methyl-2-oxobutanoate hydroxymethyltransferase [Tabrizicola piscis]AZL59335.1 3-methyl-2-oxobutanoate hydroxymethyltransferase [Tabrizicola piscis]
MTRRCPTVADLKADKGKGQKTMLRYVTLDEAAAAEAAGIDIASVPPDLVTDPRYRQAAPGIFSMTGKAHPEAGTPDDYLRFCGQMLQAGADALYCSGSLQTVEYLAREYVPVVGHVGLVPSRATFTGGFRAVGKSADQAIALFHDCRRLQEAGAFAVEIEVVPVEVATAISARLDILLWSMGAGPACDAQYLFAEDILGTNRSRLPRHAKAYRNFAAEYDRLQAERIAAFTEFRADVDCGAFPEAAHVVTMDPREHDAFLKGIAG